MKRVFERPTATFRKPAKAWLATPTELPTRDDGRTQVVSDFLGNARQLGIVDHSYRCHRVEQGPLERPFARRRRHQTVVPRREHVIAERGRGAPRPVRQCASNSRVAPRTSAVRRGSVKYRTTMTLSTPAKKHHTEMNQAA